MVDQSLINHVGLVLDRSGSMSMLQSEVVKVADGQVAELAQVSTQMDQETRATVYQFGDTIECLYYDKDVLRLPTLQGRYRISGNTALVDATMQAITDLEKTATLYGDHAFLLYVLTDGQENASRRYGPDELKRKLGSLPDNWTIAALVPDQRGVVSARQYGFLAGNISTWSTTVGGIREVGATIRQATQGFMQQRSVGVRGSKNIFQASTAAVDKSQLKVLPKNGYEVLLVGPDYSGWGIRDFVTETTHRPYRKGSAYYQLTKKEDIQPSKDVLLMDKDGTVFYGIEAREMIGVPTGAYAEVLPENHLDYTIFVRSDSVNRKLVANTMLVVRK